MSLPDTCSNLPPIPTTNYEPKGTTFSLNGLEVYETVNQNVNRILICAYDIHGLHLNTKQVVDTLAERSGFRVVMPDFFRGTNFGLYNVPPAPNRIKAIHEFVSIHGNWDKTVREDFTKVLNHYKENEKIESFGVLGFCWGARPGIDSLVEIGCVKAAALIHAAFWTTDDARKMKKPTFLLPTKDDEDMAEFYDILRTNLGEENCYHQRLEDIHHGFFSARANLQNELNRVRVDESIESLANFFNKHVH